MVLKQRQQRRDPAPVQLQLTGPAGAPTAPRTAIRSEGGPVLPTDAKSACRKLGDPEPGLWTCSQEGGSGGCAGVGRHGGNGTPDGTATHYAGTRNIRPHSPGAAQTALVDEALRIRIVPKRTAKNSTSWHVAGCNRCGGTLGDSSPSAHACTNSQPSNGRDGRNGAARRLAKSAARFDRF